VHLILSRLGRIWLSSATARLAQLSRPRGAEIRQQPYTVRAGDGCKVGRYSGVVSIIRVLIVLWPVLTITRAIVCVYGI